MAAREGFLKFGIAAVNLVIVALMFTSIWPFPHGDFKVDLPSASEVTWSYSGGVVHVLAPYSIDNGGYYDVKELVLSYNVVNVTGYPLADQTIPIGDVPAGRVTSSELDFTFDLLKLFNDGALGMVFSDDLLRFRIDVSCLYTMKLVKFEAAYQVSVPWEALIKGYGISSVSANLPNPPSFTNPPPYYLDIVYWLDTADMLNGLPDATVALALNTSDIGPAPEATTSIPLGGNNTGTLSFDLATLPLGTTIYGVMYRISVAGFVWMGEYPIQDVIP